MQREYAGQSLEITVIDKKKPLKLIYHRAYTITTSIDSIFKT